jgi:hypothetical protein
MRGWVLQCGTYDRSSVHTRRPEVVRVGDGSIELRCCVYKYGALDTARLL